MSATTTTTTTTATSTNGPSPTGKSKQQREWNDFEAAPISSSGHAAHVDVSDAFKSRHIDKMVESREQAEGLGARVRRSIGRPELPNLDPFLMLDEMRADSEAGFPDHPHRGFETVSYMFPHSKGSILHEDFAGHKGEVGPGDVQWMTAGRGILHSEMPSGTGLTHGLQLWVNLASKDKMVKPAYQELKAKKIPHVQSGGVRAIVIAGTALGITSPVYTRTPTSYIHFYMDPNTTLKQAIPADWNSFIYTISGEAYIGGEKESNLALAHHTVTLKRDGDGIVVHTKNKACEFVLLAGKPHNEPIVQHGPFVMNNRDQIMQAFQDFQSAKNGFERAKGWKSEIGKKALGHHDDDDDY